MVPPLLVHGFQVFKTEKALNTSGYYSLLHGDKCLVGIHPKTWAIKSYSTFAPVPDRTLSAGKRRLNERFKVLNPI